MYWKKGEFILISIGRTIMDSCEQACYEKEIYALIRAKINLNPKKWVIKYRDSHFGQKSNIPDIENFLNWMQDQQNIEIIRFSEWNFSNMYLLPVSPHNAEINGEKYYF